MRSWPSPRTRPPMPTGPPPPRGLYPPGSTFKIITAGAAIDRDMATPNTLLGCPGDDRHRPAQSIPNYGEFDLGTVPMSQGVRQLVQHHLRRTGQPDAADAPDRGRLAVRHRARLPDRRHHHGVGFGAADGQPRRAHRGRLRPGQGAGQPVRDGAGGGHGGGGQNSGAATDRGQADR